MDYPAYEQTVEEELIVEESKLELWGEEYELLVYEEEPLEPESRMTEA